MCIDLKFHSFNNCFQGLDPASPSFEDYGKNVRLDKTDAYYVDVIYTNAGTYGNIEGGHLISGQS